MSGSQIKTGAILGYINILVKNIVNLIYTPLLLSFVGQADYGVFQTSNAFVSSLSILSFGFSDAYVRFYTQTRVRGTKEDINRLNGLYLALYTGLSVLALFAGLFLASGSSFLFSDSFTEEQIDLAGTLMFIMAFNVALTLFSTVFDAFILVHEEFKFQQSRQIMTTAITPLISVALLQIGLGVVSVAVSQLIVVIVLLLVNARYAINKLAMRFTVKAFNKKLFISLIAFSAWIFSNQVCELVNQSVPHMILGAVSGAIVVSIFAVAVQIRQVFYSLSTAISTMFVPKINQIVAERNDATELTKLMTSVGRCQAMVFVYVYCGFILLGDFFIQKWAGPEFSSAYWLILVMVGPLIIPLTQNTGIEIQRAKNKHRARSLAYLVTALLNLVLTAVLARPLGYWAPVVGYVSYVVLGCGLFMNWYYHYRIGLDMRFFWKRVVPIVVGGICVVLLSKILIPVFMPIDSWVSFVVTGLVYSVLYFGLLYAKVMCDDERQSVIGLFRR